jgi:tungstate transport system substrate-binding protein
MRRLLLALALISGLTAWAAPALAQPLRMATTTSTADTGLLDYLTSKIKAATGIELAFVATGTGKALALGQSCDADVLLVHAPAAEKRYVADGFGVDRREVMYNDFIIVGPVDDPAKVKGQATAQALAAMARAKAVFVSRGDKSGTHMAELDLWKAVGLPVPDKEGWYVQAGQGMMATLSMAGEKKGYTLVDRGTFIKYEDAAKGKPALVILVQGDRVLFNQYAVITVNPAKCPAAKAALAKKLSDWLVSAEGQKTIAGFKLLGQQLLDRKTHV